MLRTKPLLQETVMGSHTHVHLCGGDRHTIGWSNAQNLILPFYSCLQDLLLCFKTYLKLISAIILKSLTLGNIETQHTFKLIPHFFLFLFLCDRFMCLLELRDFCVCYHIEVSKWKFVFQICKALNHYGFKKSQQILINYNNLADKLLF